MAARRPSKLGLDFGCGHVKATSNQSERWIGVDGVATAATDLVAAWFGRGSALPFRDGVFTEVRLSHVLEHLAEPVDFLLECARVLQDDGVIEIRVPHHTNRWAYEVNHRTYFNLFSLEPLCTEGARSGEASRRFTMVERELRLRQPADRGGRPPSRLVSRIETFLNRHPILAEKYIVRYVTAYECRFVLRPVASD